MHRSVSYSVKFLLHNGQRNPKLCNVKKMRDIGSLRPKRESQIPPYRSQGILRESRKIAGGDGKQPGSKVWGYSRRLW